MTVAITSGGEPRTVTTPRVSAVRTRGIEVAPATRGANIESRIRRSARGSVPRASDRGSRSAGAPDVILLRFLLLMPRHRRCGVDRHDLVLVIEERRTHARHQPSARQQDSTTRAPPPRGTPSSSSGRSSSVGETTETSAPSGSCANPTRPASRAAADPDHDSGESARLAQQPASLVGLATRAAPTPGRSPPDGRRGGDQHGIPRPRPPELRFTASFTAKSQTRSPVAGSRRYTCPNVSTTTTASGDDRRGAREEHRAVEPRRPSLCPVGQVERTHRLIGEADHRRARHRSPVTKRTRLHPRSRCSRRSSRPCHSSATRWGRTDRPPWTVTITMSSSTAIDVVRNPPTSTVHRGSPVATSTA